MAGIPESVATNIVQRLVDRAINETYYLCCFKKIVGDFEEERKELVAKRDDVQKDIEDNKNAVKEIVEEVKLWQERADAQIAEDTNTKKSCFFGWCRNCIWQYQRGKDLEEKTQRIKELVEKQFDRIGRPAKPPDIEYHSSPSFTAFDSRKLVYDKLLVALKNGEIYMIALQGIGGSGKTTLAIKVGEIVKEEKFYDIVILVTVSNNPDVKMIQDQIAKPLGVGFNQEENNLDRAKKLWSRLTNGERVLIVLDDVWKMLKFEDIGIPSAHDHKGCHVLLTTRDLNVCRQMGCQDSIFQMDVLSKNEAWIFFQKHSGINANSSKKLKDTAEKIARECKGLPVALVAVASTLKGQPFEDWKAALRSLENPRPVDIIDNELKEVYQSLKVSYDFLNNEHAQKLFKLCSLFPEDQKIPVEELTSFAVGLGLYGEMDSYTTARDDMHRAKKRLIESCLLMEVDEGEHVKMHDLIRDVAKVIANDEIQLIVGPKLNYSNTEKQREIRYLYCQNVNNFFELLACPKLEILIVDTDEGRSPKVPEAFFQDMNNLKVLGLWCRDWRRYLTLKLPGSIELLKGLRTLHLKHLKLEDIYVLEKLHKLETLEFIRCFLIELPNGIVDLDKLRLLRMEKCRIERSPLEVIGKLSKIEELYFVGNFGLSWEFNRELVVDLFDKDNISPKLQRYRISLENVPPFAGHFNIADSVSKGVGIQQFFTDSISNRTIKNLMQGAEYLGLKKIQNGYSCVIPSLVKAIGGDMNELTQLEIESYSGMRCLIDTTDLQPLMGTIFSNCINLQLTEIYDLKELCKGHQIPPNLFEKLRWLYINRCSKLHGKLLGGYLNLRRLEKLVVEHCPMLTSLFTFSTAQSLVALKRLQITQCRGLKDMVTEDRKEGEEIVHDHNELLLLPGLGILMLNGLPNLISIFPESLYHMSSSQNRLSPKGPLISNSEQLGWSECLLKQTLALSSVKTMSISQCHKLKSLFTLLVASTVTIETLRIEKCDGMEHIITGGGDCQNHSNSCSIFPKLKSLYIKGCSILESIFPASFSNILPDQNPICIFPKLEKVSVSGSNALEFIFPACLSGNLLHLKSIYIMSALELKYVFGQHHQEDNLSYLKNNLKTQIDLPALEDFELYDLPKIINICPNNFYTTWPTPKLFTLSNCSLLRSITDFGAHCNTRQLDKKTRKNFKEILKKSGDLEGFQVSKVPKIEGILQPEELPSDVPHVTTKLKKLILEKLPELTDIFTGPKDFLCLENLETLKIAGCEKLKTVFSVSILRRLPQLSLLFIEDCNELDQLIEEDNVNQNLPNPQSQSMFLLKKLAAVVVINCPKLKYLFRCNEFPELELLIIRGASELEEILTFEQCDITEPHVSEVPPKLKYLILLENSKIAKFCQWFNAPNRVVHGCPNLNLSSTTNFEELKQDMQVTGDLAIYLREWFEGWVKSYPASELKEIYPGDGFEYKENSNENPTLEATSSLPSGLESEVVATLEYDLPSSRSQRIQETVKATSNDSKPENQLIESYVQTKDASPQILKERQEKSVRSCHASEEPAVTTSPTPSQEIENEIPQETDTIKQRVDQEELKYGKTVQELHHQELNKKELINETIGEDQQKLGEMRSELHINDSQNDQQSKLVIENSEKLAMGTSSASSPSCSAILLQDTTSHVVQEPIRSSISESETINVAESKESQEDRTHTQIQERRASEGSVAEELNRIEDEMKVFYASIEKECSAMPLPKSTGTSIESVNARASEETQKALEILQELLSKKFTLLLNPGRLELMNNVLEYLLNLSPEDGISSTMKSAMEELSRSFRKWSLDYSDANLKLGSTNANLSKLEKLEEGLAANIKEFKEVAKLENGICNHLAYLEKKKRELEAEIADYKSARDTVAERKRQVFENGRMLKAEKEDLWKRAPQLRDEQEWARTTKASIESKWSKLGQQFMESSGFDK